MQRVRPKLSMDEGAKHWLYKTARKNFWRVANWMDLDDLIQDGFWHYERLLHKYPNVYSRRHIMALFKRTYLNHLHDLSSNRTKELEAIAQFEPASIDPDPSHLLHLVSKAPIILRTLLAELTKEQTPQRLRAPYRLRPDHRETFNERLCRIAGCDPDTVDLTTLIKAHFE